MTRSDADPYTLITNQNTGEELINAKDFGFTHDPAVRLRMIYETCTCWGIGIGYMGIDSWLDPQSRGGPISPTLFGPGNTPFPSSAPGTVFDVVSGTDLQSAEVNLRRRCNECLTWVAGFRWIELGDDLRARQSAPTVVPVYSIDTNNHMYGPQFGFDAELINCQQRFHVDGIFRIGVLFNNADQSTDVFVTNQNISVQEDHTAFMTEFGLRAAYDITHWLTVTGGYHTLLLDGVALAPDQIPTTSIISPTTSTLDTGGTLFFHGATFGLTGTF